METAERGTSISLKGRIMGRVLYDKELREKALGAQQGLITIQVTMPGKSKGKRGMSMTLQSQANEAECKRMSRVFLRFIQRSHT